MSTRSLEETRTRYLYAEYHCDEERGDETYTLCRFVFSDDRWESSVNGFTYHYLGQILVPEKDFQEYKDREKLDVLNSGLYDLSKKYGSITNENAH